jgi:hypothetical protein
MVGVGRFRLPTPDQARGWQAEGLPHQQHQLDGV